MLRRMSTYVVPLVLLTGAMGGAAVAEAPASALADLRARFCSPEPPRSIGPLYWYHGEDDADILEGIDKVHEGGMGNFTIESRPHSDYLGPKWWHDIEISLDRAKQLGMQVYIFDEKWFPSGIAGGLVQATSPRFWRHWLQETTVPVDGPQADFRCDVPEGEQVAGAVAVRRGGEPSEMLDLRERVSRDGRSLAWPAPAGQWDVFVYTMHSDAGHHDVLNPEATARFIELTHEETYRRFKDYFGTTLVGFFMDEPGFYNGGGQWPWTYDLAAEFRATKGYDLCAFLPALTHPEWASYRWVRYDYMDVLTRRYAAAFYKPIQDWCRAHGVVSMGHLIEHESTHQGLGAGPGHALRMMKHLDMGGIDLVFHQVMPGSRNTDYWGMPKLASSPSHLYGMRNDLAMNETYGASGWTTGLPTMKWLADWQMVRGINFLIPHAFNPTYPDPDCPPHFWAKGNDPQWMLFRHWADYTNRVCALLTGGRHVAPAAVLYTAESSWAGHADLIELVEAELLKAQYDFDLLDFDLFLDTDACRIRDGALRIAQEQFPLLVLPGVDAIPVAVMERIARFVGNGGTLLSTCRLPQHSCERGQDARVQALVEQVFGPATKPGTLRERRHGSGGRAVFVPALGGVARALEGLGRPSDCTAYPRFEDLRYIHRVKDGADVFFLTNESIDETFSGTVSLAARGMPEIWDALAGTIEPAKVYSDHEGRTRIPLTLAPYESALIVFGSAQPSAHVIDTNLVEVLHLDVASGGATVTGIARGASRPYATALAGGHYWHARNDRVNPLPPIELPAEGWTITRAGKTVTGALGDWSREDPHFSGSAKYTCTFLLPHDAAGPEEVELDLGAVGEIARVWINDQLAAELICPPYRARVTRWVRDGENRLTVEVANTLANYRVSQGEPPVYARVLPSGLMGPVRIARMPVVTLELAPVRGPVIEPRIPGRRFASRSSAGNYAHVLNGGTVEASSTLSGNFPAESVIDGDRTGSGWEQGTGGWNDATNGQWGDWIVVAFDGEKWIDRVEVTTLQDSYRGADEPSAEARFTRYGIVDFDVEAEVGNEWRVVGSVRGNDLVRRTVRFAPLRTQRIRVVVHRGLEGYSRIVEIGAYGPQTRGR